MRTWLTLSLILAACSSNSTPAGDTGVDSPVVTECGCCDGTIRPDPDRLGCDVVCDTCPDAGSDAATDTGVDVGDSATDDAGSDAAIDASDACVPPPCPAPPAGCDYVGTDPCVCGELVCDGTACAGDEDCPGGFCRATMTPAPECHPWAAEGGSCGGFTVPWGVERCDPTTHACLSSSPLIADAPGVCLLQVTIEELTANPERYRDRVVGVVTSWVTHGVSACTRIGCSAEMPCCNDCTSSMVAKDTMSSVPEVALQTDAGVAYECTGDECMMFTTCTVAVDQEYRIIGTFDGSAIRVRSIQRTSFGL